MSVVLDLNDREDHLAGLALDSDVMFGHEHRALQLVLAFFVAALVFHALEELFLHFFDLLPGDLAVFALDAHLLQEAAHHLFPVVTATMVALMAVVSSVVGAVVSAVLLSGLAFIQNGNHHGRRSISVFDLEEGVIVAHVVFTLGAVVEVLTYRALVPDANDWVDAASVALHALVHHLGILGLFNSSLFDKLVKNAGDGLFEFLLDEALDRSARHTFSGVAVALGFLALLAFAFDGLVAKLSDDLHLGQVKGRDDRWEHLWDLLKWLFFHLVLLDHLDWLVNWLFDTL